MSVLFGTFSVLLLQRPLFLLLEGCGRHGPHVLVFWYGRSAATAACPRCSCVQHVY
jgi:hypothetical protein